MNASSNRVGIAVDNDIETKEGLTAAKAARQHTQNKEGGSYLQCCMAGYRIHDRLKEKALRKRFVLKAEDVKSSNTEGAKEDTKFIYTRQTGRYAGSYSDRGKISSQIGIFLCKDKDLGAKVTGSNLKLLLQQGKIKIITSQALSEVQLDECEKIAQSVINGGRS